jgi:dihydroorotate dehydrogenase
MNRLRSALLATYRAGYDRLARPWIFRRSAADAHEAAIALVRALDDRPLLLPLLNAIQRTAFDPEPVEVGGVALPHPFILAAGWVKGDGFETEQAAHEAVRRGDNIIPGWQSMPALVGPVEFGSFTRWPRVGNPGKVLWRDASTRSTQNRIGLRNPGAEAAAEFLSRHQHELPPVWGINIAVSPGVTDPAQEEREALEAIRAFLRRGIRPAWFTLNLSCPNTEDDPSGNQTEGKARDLCGAVTAGLQDIPLWVKIGPNLADAQYEVLLRAFADTGVRAVVATNTMPEPTPEDPGVTAGVAGGRLHHRAVEVACLLAAIRRQHGYLVDVIGVGGVDSRRTYHDFARVGVSAVQYLSALIYRGPLAAALIQSEAL